MGFSALFALTWRTARAQDSTTTSSAPVFIGCYNDEQEERVMTLKLRGENLTMENCQTECAGANSAYMGLQYAIEW